MARSYPKGPAVSQRRIVVEEVFDASSKSSPDVRGWNMVPAFDDSLPNAPNRFAHIGNPDEVQLDFVAALLRLLESLQVGPPT